MKTASSSGRPTERSSCCWVPSPQSNRSRSPPARSSSAGSPRRAVGTEPAVPAKKTDRSTARNPSQARSGGRQARPSRAVGHAHRVLRRPAPLGRRARVEDVEPVALLVQRHVRVAEHDGVGVRRSGAAAARAAPARARRRASSGSARPRPPPPRRRGAASRSSGSSTFPRTACTGGPSDAQQLEHLDGRSGRRRAGSRRRRAAARGTRPGAPGSPRGMCVSLMIASCMAGGTLARR